MSKVADRPAAVTNTHRPALIPYAFKNTPALIERAFPAQKISVEAQKERKAGSGQTLTALGSYWKGRKPLILVRAIVLGTLLPATDDPEADLDIFEKLMAIDDEAFVRREPKLTPADIASRIELANPEGFFGFDGTEVFPTAFPINPDDYPQLKIHWKRGVNQTDKEDLIRRALSSLSYSEKVAFCKRPEELNQEFLYAPIWVDVSAHLRQFGIEAHNHEELVEQLGILRFGHRPKVGDTFCGGGSIPFEAARLGCDVYASDLNPVACMLTWGALNIIGAGEATRKKIEQAQRRVANTVDEEITKLGIEHNSRGDRAKAYLCCLETRCPQTGWMVPMAPSWVISKTRNIVAKLVPNPEQERFDIKIVTGDTEDEMTQAANGTVQKGELVFELDGETYRTPVRTIRGDYRAPGGQTRNKLRLWEKHDFKPRSDDVFQERLYAIQWITKETLDKPRQETYFASVTKEDLEREHQVERIIQENLKRWQEGGLLPDMEIEPGDKTDEPIRTRGWAYWHHLFSARQLFYLGSYSKYALELGNNRMRAYCFIALARALNLSAKLCMINSAPGHGRTTKIDHIFTNQALNVFFNYGIRSSNYTFQGGFFSPPIIEAALPINQVVTTSVAGTANPQCDVYVTDPPYGDSIHYHEITEFFIAWLRKNPPTLFKEWVWDSRRSLAIQGTGDGFRRDMVAAYKAMTEHMPDNSLQVVMFTHQDSSVWSDMASIFWGAGLQVQSAWYIATETTSELKKGGYVQGTVILVLRKRPVMVEMGFTQEIVFGVRNEVEKQIQTLTGLNQQAKAHGRDENLFEDSDLQMAGYAAALRVLTGYTHIDGQDMTAHALRPRRKGEKSIVDEIVQHTAEVANGMLVPKGLDAETWRELKGVERFYLKMLDIESTGAKKLDNYQNFAKAFRVQNYRQLMASIKPNAARLKAAHEFKNNELSGTEIGDTLLGEVFFALKELQKDEADPSRVMANLRDSMTDYFRQRTHVAHIAFYLDTKLNGGRDAEARAARVLHGQVSNERLG